MSEIKLAPSNPLIESDVYKPSKLSEAIRIGSQLAPQGFGGFWGDPSDKERSIVACALGSAAMACGVMHGDYKFTLLRDTPERRLYHSLLPLNQSGSCPECEVIVTSVIPHLNDDHLWTREQIADWLESQGL